MKLSDHLPAPPAPRCLVAQLSTDLLTEVDELLERPDLPTAHVATALKAVGEPISVSTLKRHKRRECMCPTTAAK